MSSVANTMLAHLAKGDHVKLRAPHWIGIGLIALVIAAIVGVYVTGFGRVEGQGIVDRRTEVTGIVGSEKVAFFNDPEVQAVFHEHGYNVRVSKSGSWGMADYKGLTENDFAFPASQQAADHIQQTHSAAALSTHQPFFSPMAVATFEPIMQLLEKNGAARKDATGSWELDMRAYLDLVAKDTRWNQLQGAKDHYNSPRSVLITSTDIRTSNSAGMYLSLAAYVAAGDQVISSQQQADQLLPQLERLFLAQGYSGSSSTAPFEDYLNQGMGAVPMVMIYEGQFLEEQLRQPSRITNDMVLAYPSPTTFSTHTGVTFSGEGQQVMQLLETDARLAALQARHGFRPQGVNAAEFTKLLQERSLEGQYRAPSGFPNIAQEPTYEVLDYMLRKIGEKYTLTGAVPPPIPEEEQSDQGGTP